MPTLVIKSAQPSQLAAALSPIETPTQLDRMAAIKSCTDLAAWLEADTLYQTSGEFAGWRERVTGKLFLNTDEANAYPAVQNIAGFNNKASLLFPPTEFYSGLTDDGADLHPHGNVDFTRVVVGKGNGTFGTIISDDEPLETVTSILTQPAGGIDFRVGGQVMAVSDPGLGNSPFVAIDSFKYAGSGASTWTARINRGAQVLSKTSGITGVPAGATLALGCYNGGSTAFPDGTIAAVLIFRGALLHGDYLTTTYANLGGATLSEIIEAYVLAKYGI